MDFSRIARTSPPAPFCSRRCTFCLSPCGIWEAPRLKILLMFHPGIIVCIGTFLKLKFILVWAASEEYK